MVKILKSIEGNIVKTFTLDRPQPVKHPMFMDFPVAGVFQIAGQGVASSPQTKRITVKDYKALNKLLYNRSA